MSEKDNDSFRDTIIPKSDQLNYDDLIAGPIDITIRNAKRTSDTKQPIALEIGDGRQPYKPCKGMRRAIITLWGDKGQQWIGKRLRLWGNPEVTYGGERVGGIEISHASGITEPVKILVTVSKSKRKEITIYPLADTAPKTELAKSATTTPAPYPWEKFESAFDAMRVAITSGKMTAEQVILKCEKTGALNDSQRGRIMAAAGVADNVGGEFSDDLPL